MPPVTADRPDRRPRPRRLTRERDPVFDVCVVGSSNLDLVVTAATPARCRARRVLRHELRTSIAGGKGLNQVVAATRAGAACTFVAALGDDDAGDRLAAVLAEPRASTRALVQRHRRHGDRPRPDHRRRRRREHDRRGPRGQRRAAAAPRSPTPASCSPSWRSRSTSSTMPSPMLGRWRGDDPQPGAGRRRRPTSCSPHCGS